MRDCNAEKNKKTNVGQPPASIGSALSDVSDPESEPLPLEPPLALSDPDSSSLVMAIGCGTGLASWGVVDRRHNQSKHSLTEEREPDWRGDAERDEIRRSGR